MAVSKGLAITISEALERGDTVEIKLSTMFSDMEQIASAQPAGTDWLKITLKGLPDVKHFVPVDRIDCIRVRSSEE